jgi:hypothetical protein
MQIDDFREAVRAKSLATLTKAIGKLTDELSYRLTPPYTEITEFKSKEYDNRYRIHFSGISRLNYEAESSQDEGLVFAIDFGGDAFSDVPTPPTHELFYAGKIRTLKIYGYGGNWTGRMIRTPTRLQKSLDLKIAHLHMINNKAFCNQLKSR